MVKQLLLLTAACMLLSAILTGCGVRKTGAQNKSEAKITDPKTRDSLYWVSHPREVIGTDWKPAKYSPLVLLSESRLEYFTAIASVNMVFVEQTWIKKNPKLAKKEKNVKIAKKGSGKGIQAKSKTEVDPAVVSAQDPAKPAAPASIDTRPDTTETLAGNVKADTVEPIALAISKPAPAGPNPGLLGESGEDAAPSIKPLNGAEMDAMVGKYAGLISVEPKEITNYSLYRFIDDWYGIEYKWGGDDNSGIDCSGLSQKLYEEVYNVDISRTAREQYKSCDRIKNSGEAGQGDLVFFRMHHIRISHVGVYLANGYFVHASRSQGVVISSLKTKYWRRRFAGCGRISNEDPDTESENIP